MNYFLDTEFNEEFRRPIGWLPTIGRFNRRYHTVDLISIGIVAEDGREYYAVSNEFNVRAAWKKWQIGEGHLVDFGRDKIFDRVYWLRDNVLLPIWQHFYIPSLINLHHQSEMTLSGLRSAVKHGGKSRKQIACDILDFCGHWDGNQVTFRGKMVPKDPSKPVFYGYYADYDWVAFCGLFGAMINLPKGMPMYCVDLKQMLDQRLGMQANKYEGMSRLECWLHDVKNREDYPKQTDEHHALADAKWNQKLYNFITKTLDMGIKPTDNGLVKE